MGWDGPDKDLQNQLYQDGSGAYQQTVQKGTSYEKTWNPNGTENPLNAYQHFGMDPRNYMYGRSPTGADDAVARTTQIANVGGAYGAGAVNAGNVAAQTGQNLLGQRTGDAAYFNGRQTGNPQAMQLAGLEAQQGPSGAQAQLQGGTNQALASQLALARSGRGFGGNAAAAGQAAGNAAGIQANQANQAAGLAAQENAAWRGRQASNLANSAGIQLNSQGQNDAQVNAMLGLGQQGYFQGVGAQNAGYAGGIAGVGAGLQGQQVNNQTRGQELDAGKSFEDNQLRAWAAQNGYTLGAQQAQDQKNAGYVNAAAGFFSNLL
jgi:hypothetical protein